ncbi:MAG: hypothetical protein IT432_04065 [Phycisphaerales bacterium]|nr:hypothetical protein [Phycisphaerales bacterium]
MATCHTTRQTQALIGSGGTMKWKGLILRDIRRTRAILAESCRAAMRKEMGATGLEPVRDAKAISHDSDSRGNKSGNIGAGSGGSEPPRPTPPTPPATPADPELAAIVAAWPILPAVIRAGVLALVRAGNWAG